MKLTLDTLANYCTEEGECLLWNLGCNSHGWPIARVDGKVQNLRRYIYAELMGKMICPRECVSTRCGNKTCLSPACLCRKTRSMVNHTMNRNGTRAYDSAAMRSKSHFPQKLTMDIARLIRTERMSDRNADLAREYGVGKPAISRLKAGETWRDPAPHSVFGWRG